MILNHQDFFNLAYCMHIKHFNICSTYYVGMITIEGIMISFNYIYIRLTSHYVILRGNHFKHIIAYKHITDGIVRTNVYPHPNNKSVMCTFLH